MTVQLISTVKRPNTETPWVPSELIGIGWDMSDQQFLDTWHEKGRLLSTSITISEDQLTVTMVREFLDWQSLDDFTSDANLNTTRLQRNTYNDQVGIQIINIETKEVL